MIEEKKTIEEKKMYEKKKKAYEKLKREKDAREKKANKKLKMFSMLRLFFECIFLVEIYRSTANWWLVVFLSFISIRFHLDDSDNLKQRNIVEMLLIATEQLTKCMSAHLVVHKLTEETEKDKNRKSTDYIDKIIRNAERSGRN